MLDGVHAGPRGLGEGRAAVRFGASVLFTLLLSSCTGAAPPSTSKAPEQAGSAFVPPAPIPSASPAAPAATAKESKEIQRTLARVSQLRGVTSTRAVPGVKLDRGQLVGRIKEKALREYPADTLRREGQLLQLFGFAPPTFDYLAQMMTLLEAQLEGFYEPNDGTMYLAGDLHGPEAAATLAHELVHALQDQHWDLKSRSTYRPGKGDETLALACLAEGDATSVMIDYLMAEQGKSALDVPDAMMRELMGSGMNTPAVEAVPHVLRTSLVAPYIDGLAFVHGLRRRGGWSMVDGAWEKPPTTTEQVLHLEKWQTHEPALTVSVPSATTLGSDWKRDDEDTFGELALALMFEEWLGPADARRAAADWGGDRSAVYIKGDDVAFAVRIRYDAVAAAERAAKTLAGLKKTLGNAAVDAPTKTCFERADLGPLVVARKDRDIVVTAGPARGVSPWKSTSSCAVATKWADEIVASP